MLPVQLTLHNGFQNRGGIECAHSFIYKSGQQLTANQKQMVVQSCGFISIHDIEAEGVYAIIKAYMRDIDLNQPPLLVLEPRDAEKVFGTSPPSVVPLKPLGKKSVEAIAALIHFLKLPQYGLHAAVGALVDLRDNTAYELNSLTWLDVGRRLPIRPPEPVENAIFDHLPKITWPLRLRPGGHIAERPGCCNRKLGWPINFLNPDAKGLGTALCCSSPSPATSEWIGYAVHENPSFRDAGHFRDRAQPFQDTRASHRLNISWITLHVMEEKMKKRKHKLFRT